MARKPTLDVEALLEPDRIASDIGNQWQDWDSFRDQWKSEKKELRNYIFATDTKSTTNKRLPWSNSTTSPKLTQIFDNLKANYMSTLFPSSNWMRWEGEDKDSGTKLKRDTIQAYMRNKLKQGSFETDADRLVDDFILSGNCFATVEFVTEYIDLEEGDTAVGFIGPRVVRISPYDIVFNPVASSFENSPKIIRSLVSLGELKRDIANGDDYKEAVFDRMIHNRKTVAEHGNTDKADGYIADGFSSIAHYYGSNYVELLTYYGDIYDTQNERLLENRMITVVDRAYVIQDVVIPSWLGKAPIFHAGWRNRPDNLWAMGPLDNLVGMQYRIDHLENLKADVFDQIALPILKIRGDVEDFIYEPGARIYLGEEGDVAPMAPDTTALQADFQIQMLENKMEALAGAPREAMGIRTPGEKTAYEVQSLQNAASRIFQHKANQFEREFVEPLLNAMLVAARQNMNTVDIIRTLDDSTGADVFRTITKEDLLARGTLRPVGARHFAERAKRVQEINQLLQAKSMPDVGVHLSGKEAARLLTEELGEPALFGENIAIQEQMQTQRVGQDAEVDMMEELSIAAEEGL